MRYGVRGHLLNAGVCHLCKGDIVAVRNALERYQVLDPTFSRTRENELLTELVAAYDEQDVEKFTEVLKDYDSLSPLGSEVILGDMSHIHISENGGISTVGGVHPRTVKNNKDGTMDLDLIEAAIRDPEDELHYPTTRLICIENSHANSGGRCLTVEYTDKVGELAKKHGLKLHIDGARIFNAATALGVPVDRLVQAADSVSVCVSKGIGAPVGTVIVGSKNFITKARTCAAALVAVQDNVKKLENDHRNAKLLADGLNQIAGLKVDMNSVETNIIYVYVCETSNTTAPRIGKYLEDHGILVVTRSTYRMRIVLHYQVTTSDVQHALICIREALNGASSEHSTSERQ